MRELNLDHLRTLVAIVEHGSFVAAARVLHLAPPTVSLHINELEERLGAQLLLRKRKKAEPTGVGAALIERAQRLLNQTDAMLDDIQLYAEGKTGRVRVSAATPVIAYLLPAALERLSQKHPGIEVELAVLNSTAAMDKLAKGMLDIAAVALPQGQMAEVLVRPWRKDPVVALIPAHWDHPEKATASWLATKPLILNDDSTQLARITNEWFAAAGLRPQANIRVNYNDSAKSLVGAGYGATLLSYETLYPQIDKRIKTLQLDPPLWRPMGIAHRSGPLEIAVKHVLEELRRI
ncbi:LysR family transcriptional regulator [Pusillimonas sp. MFBS29]|uniref:LysR family transcriptional regulator n=1 Tax=Pusillimonas sp. MFBS29 TaxID=2886690 RepID=UPI001D1068DD|nr:LysR family transcriptional regulator [Pusillimonas sp. MFBS29]MCC2594868.1 LysR family transcriptional regulator [Pusillimonas sp. MFBS29]